MIGPELKLLAACCRASFVGHDAVASQEPLSGIDWDLFARLAMRHRVQGFAWRGIDELALEPPAPVAEALNREARAVAEHELRGAAECARLLDAFERRGVPILFLKGVTLGALAYRDPFLKMGWDIDVLVPLDRVTEAGLLLAEAGYISKVPTSGSKLSAWHQRHKESVWHHGANGFFVELHTRLADQPKLIPAIGWQSPIRTVEVASGIALPTLASEQLFAYLCVHGASSAWFRLKWIADLAGFLARRSADDVAVLYERSQSLGAGRAAGQALLLAHGLFATALSRDLRQNLESDRAVRWLARAASGQLAAEREPTQRPFGTAMIHLTQLLILPGLDYKSSELRRQIGDAIG